MQLLVKCIYLLIVAGLLPIVQEGDTFYAFHWSPSVALAQSDADDNLQWQRPRFPERQKERLKMVEKGIKNRGISSSKVLDAMRRVPRHKFIPEVFKKYAYQNRPLPIGHNQTISQPYIVAYMTQMLDLGAGDKVLEIGTGSGYQAAVLTELTPEVYTIEIVKPLAEQAHKRFKSLGYNTIKTKTGDGYRGWKKHAPYDAIILTAAPEQIPKPLIDQLARGGILVAPVGKSDKTQMLTKVTKAQNGDVIIKKKLPVRFVPMTGNTNNNRSSK